MQQNTFYFNDGPFLQTLQGLASTLLQEEALVTLIGIAHTGKSSLCERLTEYLIDEAHTVVYFDGDIESPEMLRSLLARGLDLPDAHNFFRLLEDKVTAEEAGGRKPIILIFDDAHRLDDSTLKEIYRLTEIQVNMKRILNIVLCAEPALEQRLRREKQFRQLLLQVSHRFYLQPMDADTINRFLILYLQQAGKTGLQLEAAALPTFYKLSKGFPGLAARLCQLVVDARLGETDLWAVSKTELENLVQRSAPAQSRIKGFFLKANTWSVAGPIAAVLLVLALVLLYQIVQSSYSNGGANAVNPEAAVQERTLQ